MDFNLTEEDKAFRDELRAWLDANLPEEERLSSVSFLFEEGDEMWDRRLAWHRKMAAAKWVGVGWPREYGGRAASLMQQAIYAEELERARAPRLVNNLGIMLVGPTLMVCGTEEQKSRYVPRILTAEEIWCQGYSEPNAGSDVASLQTRAVEEGDYFIINGQKVWTSDAQHADWCILLVRTDPSAPKHKGISYLLVNMHSPGVTVRPLVQITGNHGFNEVFFEDVRVPKENLVGRKNEGWQVAITTLMFERSGTGGHRDFSTHVRELAKLSQMIVRDGRPACDDPTVRQRLAQFAIEASALKYMVLRHLTMRLRGTPPGPEGSMVKLFAAELNLKMNSFAMEMMGPYGVLERDAPFALDEGKWSLRMLASRGLCIAGGTSEIQHNIIGDRVLGLPKG